MATDPEPFEPDVEARQWLLTQFLATLCTTAVQEGLEGHPYGSVAPFALDATGRPVILISSLAAHTKNLAHDPRAALVVQQPDAGDDPQAGWRITVMGTFTRVQRDHPEREALHARYVQRVPDAVRYDAMQDFDYWRMSTITKARYVGGFGKIGWLSEAKLTRQVDPDWAEAAASAVAHMNEDHAHNLVEMCQGFYGIAPARATMLDLDPDGLLVRAEEPDQTVFIGFGRAIRPNEIRKQVIRVLADARARQDGL